MGGVATRKPGAKRHELDLLHRPDDPPALSSGYRHSISREGWTIDDVEVTECRRVETEPKIVVEPRSLGSRQGLNTQLQLPLRISNVGTAPLE